MEYSEGTAEKIKETTIQKKRKSNYSSVDVVFGWDSFIARQIFLV